MLIEQLQSLLNTVLLGYPKARNHLRLRTYFLLTLFIIGVIYWVGFFGSGNLLLNTNDWIKEDAYLNTLRFAQINKLLPWQWSEPFYHNTDKFLANPEIVLTPDIIFLRWVSNGVFIIFHTVLFYTVGFLGSLLLAKKFNARFASFFFFWLLFNFNGHLSAQIAVGHFQWTGYFLIPFFFIFLFKFRENPQDKPSFNAKPVFGMSLLFGILFLNGSVHIAIICIMFLITALLFKWTMYPNIVTSIFIGFMLGLNRLLPAAFWFPSKGTFGQGYPTISSLLDAFTALRLYDFSGLQEFREWNWWEYDFYIGFVAFIIFVISIAVVFKRRTSPLQSHLLKTATVFLLLSLGNIYNIINILHLPFIGIERVPSRFIVMPFILFLTVSMTGIDELINSHENGVKTLAVIALPFVISELYFHYEFWRIQYIEYSVQNIEKPMLLLIPCSNQAYIMTVYVSWIASFVSLSLVLLFFVPKTMRKL
jgi:hypothetical protein